MLRNDQNIREREARGELSSSSDSVDLFTWIIINNNNNNNKQFKLL